MTLSSGFADPVIDAAHGFRAILDAMARPGTIHGVGAALDPSAPFERAAAAVLLTLTDHDTPVWLPASVGEEARRWLAFHAGAPVVVERSRAAFAWLPGPEAALPLDGWAIGEPAYPDRSTTLLIEVARLVGGSGVDSGVELSGPGIDGTALLDVTLPDDLLAARAALRPLHPLGLDLIVTCGDRLAALPRTTRVRQPGDTRISKTEPA